jgi:WD40 repeat protein
MKRLLCTAFVALLFVHILQAAEVPFVELKGHTGTIFSVAFSPDGKKIVSASKDITARIWDAETGKVLKKLEGHTDVLRAAVFSPDGKKIVTASGDNTARIWDAESGTELHKLEGHTDYVWSIAISPDGRKIVTASDDNTARIWDAESGKALQTLSGHTYPVVSVAFSPDGKKIVSASNLQTARIWDAETFQMLSERPRTGNHVSFSPDGKKIVSADKTVRIWDADLTNALQELTPLGFVRAEAEKERRRELNPGVEPMGPHFFIMSVAFSSDGKKIVMADMGGVQIWEAESGKELHILEGHPNLVNSATLSPDGSKVAVTYSGGIVRIYDISAIRQEDNP